MTVGVNAAPVYCRMHVSMHPTQFMRNLVAVLHAAGLIDLQPVQRLGWHTDDGPERLPAV